MTYVLFLLALILAVFMLIVIVRAVGNRQGKRRYDERQIAAQNRAYRVAYWVLMLYNLVFGAADYLAEWNWAANAYVFGAVGALLALLVWVEMCIWNNAYVRLTDRPGAQMWLLGFCGVIWLANFLLRMDALPLVENGQVQLTAIFFGLAVVYLIAWATMLLRRFLDRRADAQEAEEG